jgi:hypothetical protein
MDYYQILARRYYLAFEGTHLYPGWRDRQLQFWVLSLAAWVASLWFAWPAGLKPTSILSRGTAFYACEVVFLISCVFVVRFKKRKILANHEQSLADQPFAVDLIKRTKLRELCGVPATGFYSVAKECSDVVAMFDSQRLPSELRVAYYARKIYDPDSKARLVSIVLAACALLVAMVVKTIPNESPLLFEAFADGTAWSTTYALGVIAIIAFFIWLGLQAVLLVIWTNIAGFAEKLFSVGGGVAIGYFVRDLARLHEPVALSATLPSVGEG